MSRPGEISAGGPIAGPIASTVASGNPRPPRLHAARTAPTVSATYTPSHRLTTVRLRDLASRLSSRDHAILWDLHRLRLLPSPAVDVLHFAGLAGSARARVRRRVMNRLTVWGLIAALERRIGGVHAGSSGLVYQLTPAGHRLLALDQGQDRPLRHRPSTALGGLFLDHVLTVIDLYVRLVVAGRVQGFTVPTFRTEPDCWLSTGPGSWLRPDAYTALDNGTHRDMWCIEVDRGTESIPRIRAKLNAYRDFLTHGGTGPDGVPPRVLCTAPDPTRATALSRAVQALPEVDSGWFTVTVHQDAIRFLTTELATQ